MAETRPGETRFAFDPGGQIDAGVTFIGHLRTPWVKGTAPRNLSAARDAGSGPYRIELQDGYAPALAGLKVGGAIQVLYWVDRGERDLAVQAPRYGGGPRGTFSLRSPVRPNPIALGTCVILALDAETGRIEIDASDAFDGTPVLDIKPWIASVDVPPGWRGEG